MIKSTNKKFTLLELLLVVAIMAMLIAILLPALLKSRHSAYQALCVSNQRQLYIATVAYSKDNNNLLMPAKPNNNHPYTNGTPLSNYFLRNTRDDYNEAASNHGMLYQQNYISSARLFYCPGFKASGQARPLSDHDFYLSSSTGLYPSQEIFQTTSGSPVKVRGSYYFNPYGKTKTYTSILDYDSSLIMFTDLLIKKTLSHGILGKKWVVIRGDGSAKAVTSKPAYSIVFSTNVHKDWTSYNLALDELTEALQ